LFFSSGLKAQNNDCVTAEVICSSGAIDFNPNGPGINDFANPANQVDCLLGNEHQSAWYYFQFQPNMPPNSVITFTITPNAGPGQDYDFAIYGPDVDCSGLGFPVRCSFADQFCDFCPDTGLGMGATDFSEPPSGDGFVAPMVVQPGQGFYLLIDNFLSTSSGFSMTWGGSAAPFLDCSPPMCNVALTATPTYTFCQGAPPFQLTAGATGTNAPFYEWTSPNGGEIYLSNPFILQPTVNLPPNFTGALNYTLTLTDGNCMDEVNVTVNILPAPSPAISGPTEFCPGSSVTLSAGPGYSSYQWSIGGTGSSVTVGASATVSVTVTNAQGCTGVATHMVTALPAPMPSIAGDNYVCNGVAATLTASPGFTDYTWSTGSHDQFITVNAAGLYSVVVTDANGCMGAAQFIVINRTNPSPVISGPSQLCPGGTATLTANAGYFSYAWSTSNPSPSITINSTGVYSVTVEDGFGCIGSTTYNVTAAQTPMPTINGPLGFCPGQSATLSVGQTFSTYSWSNGLSGQSTTFNTPGAQSVTVTNAANCSATLNFTLFEHPVPTPSISGNLAFCSGSNTLLNAGSGFADYLWSNSDTTATTSINTPGTHSVTVTDNNGCMGSTSADVAELTELMPVISGDFAFCTGTSTTLTAAPGYATYEWSNDVSGPENTVNAPGIYTVSVTDSGGCSGTGSVQVSALPLPDPQISGVGSFCVGSATTLDAGSGYSAYAWSTYDSLQTTGISLAGTYSVTVTDSNGCEGSDDFSIIQTPLPVPTISGVPGFCPGLSTELNVPGNYTTYQWNTNDNSATLAVSAPGTYSVTVADALGCQGSASVLVAEFNTTDPVISGNLNYCPGGSTILTASPGYSVYQWNPGGAGASITATQEGIYTVTVSDSNGCETSASVQASEFVVVPPAISGIDEFCAGSSVTLTGQAGYSNYIWSNSTTGAVLNVNAGGIYSLSAMDANGCESETVMQVTEHPLPTPGIGGSLSYCIGGQTTLNASGTYAAYLWTGGTTGSTLVVTTPGSYGLTVTDNFGCIGSTQTTVVEDSELSPVVSGPMAFCENSSTVLDAGVGYATYLWTGGIATQTLTVTAPGTYTLSVTDGMGCSGTASVNVLENPLPQPQISGASGFCENASTTLDAGPGFSDYLWSNAAFTPAITVTDGGTYSVTVTDQNGCVSQTALTVTEHPLPQVIIVGDPYFCEGAAASLSTNPAFPAYQWSTAESVAAIQATVGGAYQVTVTDANGCQAGASFLTDLIPLPQADAGPDQFLDCNITALAIGGGGSSQGSNFAYQWSGPGITPANEDDRFPLVGVAGNYTLVVNDIVHGCQSLPASLQVADLAYTPAVNLAVSEILDCNTPSVTLDGTGSQSGAGIVYAWFHNAGVQIPGATGITWVTSQQGAYSLHVTDLVTGCHAQQSVNVQADFNYPVAEAGLPEHLNCIQTNAILDASASSSGAGIVYSWHTQDGYILSGGATVNPNVDAPGVYVLTVSNTINGCVSTDAVAVTEDIQAPQAEAGQTQELNCLIPVVTLSGSGIGNASLTFNWSLSGNPTFAASGATITTDLPGMYTFLVTNTVNGCSDTDPVLVTLNPNRPTAVEITTNHPTCFGDNDGSLFIGGVSGGTPPYVYSINGQPFSNQLVYNSLPADAYEIVVQDAIGCEHVHLTALNQGNDLAVDAGPDRRINLGETTDLTALVNIPYGALASLRWTTTDTLDCPNCPEINVGPFETTAYQVMVADTNGCQAIDRVTVFVAKNRDVFIPNVFSPNNDGFNDVLMIFGGREVARIKSFMVFNRWGESVFEAYNFQPNDPFFGWNGFFRGQLCNSAVFVYMAEIEFIDGEVLLFKGDAALMH